MQLPIQVVTRSAHNIKSRAGGLQHMIQDVRTTRRMNNIYVIIIYMIIIYVMYSGAGVWRMCINQKYAVSRNEWYLFFLPPNGLLFLSNLPLFLQQQTMPSAQNVLLSKCTHSSCVAACARANKLVYTSFW